MTVPCTLPPADGRPGAAPAASAREDGGWQAAWEQHEALLRVARRRSVSRADAEDAVSEAIVRSVENGNVDPTRATAWLTSVTTRLCADAARDRAREPKRVAYQRLQGAASDSHEQAVCDRAEASWLSSRLGELPDRQRRALELRAEGNDIASIADAMSTSYKVAEGLLCRARAQMRSVLAAAAAWVAALLGGLTTLIRRRGPDSTAATTLAAASATLVVAVLQLPAVTPEPALPTAPVTRPVVDRVAPRSDAAPTSADGPRLAPSTDAPEAAPRRPQVAPTRTSAPPPAPPVEALRIPTRSGSHMDVAGVTVTDNGSSTQRPDQTFTESIVHCLRTGVHVSAELVGCSPD